jgi:hypothetical protein
MNRRNFLNYWKNGLNTRVQKLNHSASAQYRRVEVGDVLWIVTLQNCRLMLLGPLRIHEIVGLREAQRKLGRSDFYPARLHALAGSHSAERRRDIDIHDLAPKLRFESERDSLVLHRGRIDGKQIQSLRQLTVDSAHLIAQRWLQASR